MVMLNITILMLCMMVNIGIINVCIGNSSGKFDYMWFD